MTYVAGVKVNTTMKESEAWDMIDQLAMCKNCVLFEEVDLFTGRCKRHTNAGQVFFDNRCEGFSASEKKVEYWISKLVEMAQEANGSNDFYRQLHYHERNGTEKEFLNPPR